MRLVDYVEDNDETRRISGLRTLDKPLDMTDVRSCQSDISNHVTFAPRVEVTRVNDIPINIRSFVCLYVFICIVADHISMDGTDVC